MVVVHINGILTMEWLKNKYIDSKEIYIKQLVAPCQMHLQGPSYRQRVYMRDPPSSYERQMHGL